MIEVLKYSHERHIEWNNFINSSKNGTFMHKRDFIEYHKNKFHDYSLMVYINSKLIALLPANKNSNIKLVSHEGLTYGGIIVNNEIRLNTYLKVIKAIIEFLNNNGILELHVRVMPDFYTNAPSQEYQYAFFLLNAFKTRVDTSLTINQKNKINYQNRRKRSIKKGKNGDFIIKKDNNFELFWNQILVPNLNERFGTKPTHSLSEIKLLFKSFQENISQVNVYENNKIVAGATIFETKNVAHAQYISSNNYGRKSGALDYLFDVMITELYSDFDFFDFGICNEKKGMAINHGLLDWKEGFGARTFVHEFYKINTNLADKLNLIIS